MPSPIVCDSRKVTDNLSDKPRVPPVRIVPGLRCLPMYMDASEKAFSRPARGSSDTLANEICTLETVQAKQSSRAWSQTKEPRKALNAARLILLSRASNTKKLDSREKALCYMNK
ncbi:hypothetical protein HDU83_007515, partial [Entophlyctis luteolus]